MPSLDLHTHSGFSHDGDLPPTQLVERAARLGVRHLALTDHNRADGNPEALEAAKTLGITLIPGIEIDCSFEGVTLHILGYFINHLDAGYAEIRDDNRERKAKVDGEKLDRIQKLGFHINVEETLGRARDGVLASSTIADAVLSDPRNVDNPDLRPFRPGGKNAEDPLVQFAWIYMSRGGPAHVSSGNPPLERALRLIRDTGGVSALAHPGQSLAGREELLPAILKAGVQGVEVYCNYHSPEAAAMWNEGARTVGAVATCGSDFHGRVKPSIEIGRHGVRADLEPVLLESLYALKPS